MAEVIVDIDKDGNVKIEVNGVEGKACLDITESLEEALGVVESRTEKPEMVKNVQKQSQRVRN